MFKRSSLFLPTCASTHTDRSIGRHRRIVLPEVRINEIGSNYLQFWRDKRNVFGYFKLGDILRGRKRDEIGGIKHE